MESPRVTIPAVTAKEAVETAADWIANAVFEVEERDAGVFEFSFWHEDNATIIVMALLTISGLN